jgi:hypothetical protein
MLTDLRAVKVLAPQGAADTVGAGLDRLIAALAIAGGVAGLASVLGGLNPQAKTDPDKEKVANEPSRSTRGSPRHRAPSVGSTPSPPPS